MRKETLSYNELENQIAELKKQNEELKIKLNSQIGNNERYYQLLAENISDVIWIYNFSQQKFTYISPSVLELRGFTVEEALGQSIDESLSPASAQIVKQKLEINLNYFLENPTEKKYIYNELEQTCKNGSNIWIEIITNFQFNELNEIELLGVSRNIEARKKTEFAILESETRFRETAEFLPVVICEVDLTGKLEYVNKAAFNLFEQTEEDFKNGHYVINSIVPESRNIALDDFASLIINKTSSRKEYTFLTKNGTTFEGIIYSVPRLKDNNITGIRSCIIDITKRKNAEIALQETNEYLEKLFNHANAPIIVWNNNLEITRFNQAFEKLSGYNSNEVITKKIDILFPKNKIEYSLELIEKTSEGEKWETVEIEILRKDNEIRTVLWNSANILDSKNEKIVATIAQGQDITERKVAENELLLMKYSLDSASDSIFFISVEGNFIDVNNSACELLGYSRNELLKLSVTDIDIYYNSDVWKNHFTELKEKNKLKFESVHKTKNGQLIPVEIVANYIKFGNKELNCAFVRNISERKIAEKELHDSEIRLKSLVKILQYDTEEINDLLNYTLEEAVLLTNSKIGYIYLYNEETQELTLHSWSDEVMKNFKVEAPKHIYNLSHTGIWGEVIRQNKPIILNDFKAENILKKGFPTGHIELINFLSIPVIIENKIVAVAAVANKETDYEITDTLHLTILMDTTWKAILKKETDKIVKKQNEELLKLNADKDRFMTILAHDLKSPFNTILGFLDLLSANLRRYSLDKIEGQINIINSSAKQTFVLLENILTWIRSNSGKIPFSPENILFWNSCNDVVESLRNTAKNKNISIKVQAIEEISIFADNNILKTILRNLISNAIKFTDICGAIEIFAEKNSTELTVTISDNGIGIKPEIISKIFDISYKTSTEGTSKEMGTGLGLIICKEFVEKHSGKIWVESEQNIGSKFKFTIPIKNELEYQL